ncbi:hypothetical protein [Mesorhizobium sp. M0488]|uniref:hypothetical protein n=1 Tax=unclassified Mesorhizobium TaxID=325217 RepID=UPI00333D581F
MTTVKFTAMKDGDREDYEFLTAHEIDYAARTGERVPLIDPETARTRTGASA